MADEHEVEQPMAATPAVAGSDSNGSEPTPFDGGFAGAALPAPDYSAAGVPSLDFVRDKIEGRFAHSLGSAELASETPEARSAAEQQQEREKAARDKLDAIRQSLRGGSSS
ncbi:MAG TPA: hypothetical protein VIU11_09735 [Nakamurella sp.]